MRVTCLQILCKQKRTGQESSYEVSILNPIRELKHRGFFRDGGEPQSISVCVWPHYEHFKSKASNAKMSAFQLIGEN